MLQQLYIYMMQLMGPAFNAAHGRLPFPSMGAHLRLARSIDRRAVQQGGAVLQGLQSVLGTCVHPWLCTDQVRGPPLGVELA